MKVSELIAAFEEKFAASKAERSQLIAEGRKCDPLQIHSSCNKNETIKKEKNYEKQSDR